MSFNRLIKHDSNKKILKFIFKKREGKSAVAERFIKTHEKNIRNLKNKEAESLFK